jgi:hypothetical protein
VAGLHRLRQGTRQPAANVPTGEHPHKLKPRTQPGLSRTSAKPRQPRAQTRVMRSSRLQRLSATLGRGCEAFGRGRVREEQQVEQARRIEVGEVRLSESAERGLVGGLVAGELERVAVGDAFPATGDGR